MGFLRRTHWLRKRPLLLAALGCLCALTGCTRYFYRNQLDHQVAHIQAEKDQNPEWTIQQYHVYPDPRARFADETDPDHPPMPEDDLAASKLSPHPQNPGKAGVANIEGKGYLELLEAWDAENRAELKDNAEATPAEQLAVRPEQIAPGDVPDEKANQESAMAATSLREQPRPDRRLPYRLKLEQAVELSLINSREIQDQREELYLAALPVVLQRFAFSPQLFAAAQALREWSGPATPVGHGNNWTVNSNAGVGQLFSTGALLLANFANQTVVHLTGAGRGVTSQSTINLDLIQPLLQGGGLAVTLEPLTQAERNLLYQVRTYARFRKTFYVAIAGGGGGSITGGSFQPTNVIAAQSFSPDAGFGSSGLAPGVIPPIPLSNNPGLQVGPGRSGQNGLQTALNAPVSGYLSTLLQDAQIQVDRYNIEKLDAFLKLIKAMQEGGDMSQLQVDQFEQQLLAGRQSLLTDQQNYLQAIDNFKLQLGLPTDVRLDLDDADFRPLNRHFRRYEDLFNDFKAASEAPKRVAGPEMVAKVRGELRQILTTSPAVRGTRFRRDIDARWGAWEKLSADELQQRLAAYRDERRKLQDKQTDLETKGKSLSAADAERLTTLDFEIDLGDFEKVLREYESEPWKKLADPEARRRQQEGRFAAVVPAFIIVLTAARNERMKDLHDHWPKLKPLCVAGVDLLTADLVDAENAAAAYALSHRLDLMNVHGQVVDAWRQLAIFANALLGPLNVQYHLDSTTPPAGSNPLAFGGGRSHQELILNAQLPLVRVAEQNNYRAALINYQRARRILQRAEDQVKYDVRQELIVLRQFEENYRIQSRQVELAYLTVENSLDTLQAPLQPTPAGQPAQDTSTRAAALSNQLIQAQTALYRAHFQMTSIWITYLNTRDDLYRDMELMKLDNRGVWIDDVENCECPWREQTSEGQKRLEEKFLPPPRTVEPPAPAPARNSTDVSKKEPTARPASEFWSLAHSLLQRHKTASSPVVHPDRRDRIAPQK